VVLSSHLLDEVQRTCDAVAIVDRGSVVRQGPISELLAGTSHLLEVGCTDPERARTLIAGTSVAADGGRAISVERAGLRVPLPVGAGHAAIAEINRVLVDAGIAVHRLHIHETSLEEWFLHVTSRLGEPR